MTDLSKFTPEDQEAWKKILSEALKPVRWPPFPELNRDGEWTKWSADPQVLDSGLSSVQQPPQAHEITSYTSGRDTICGLQHTTLPTGYIRLLKLDQAHYDTKCNVLRDLEIIDVPLQNAPDYTALSYCWGDLQICTGILFAHPDGSTRVFRVTEDLATCFYSFMNSNDLDTPTYLWVDQICINQEDIDERNAQVKLMVEIYRNASQVLVWLGQRNDMSVFQQGIESQQIRTGPDAAFDPTSVIQFIESCSYLARGWFQRLWVFQEVAVAKEFLFVIGETPLLWEEVEDAHGRCTRWFRRNPDFWFVIKHFHLGMIKTMGLARRQLIDTGHINLTDSLPEITSSQKCREPRDMIFGLLGCAGDIFPPAFVDYRKPVHEVYRDATRLITERERSLNIINYVRYSPQSNSPTWSPYWGEHESKLDHFARKWSASCDRAHVSTQVVHPDRLQIRGKVTDTISAFIVGDLPILEYLNWSSDVITFRDLCNKIWNLTRQSHQTPSDPPSRGRFFSQLLRDTVDTVLFHDDPLELPFETEDTSAEQFYKTIVENGLNDILEHKGDETRRDIYRRVAASMDRSFAILQSGRFALVRRKHVQVGDNIAILHGLDVPCVLRRAGGESQEEWTFHGDVFVKGLMYGQGVTWKEDEADTLTLI